jgi:hypothetical protein
MADAPAGADPADAMLLCQAISGARRQLRYTTEGQLQQALAELFAAEQVNADREAHLTPADRPDFLIGGIAVEVKVKGTTANLERQLGRYLAHDRVGAAIVVTRCARHRQLPGQIGGKPVYVVWLSGLFG